MPKQKNPSCPQCGEELVNKPKTSFVSGQKAYSCDKCHYNGSLPLSTSTKIIYWTITILVLFIIFEIVSGGKGTIGIIGLIAPWSLFLDWQTNKKLRAYRDEKGIKELKNLPEESNGVLKGVACSVLIVIATFALGYYAYGNETSSTPTQTSIQNIIAKTPINEKPAETWSPFYSTEGKFQMLFPVSPKISSSQEAVGEMNVNLTLYDSTSNSGDEYMAQFANYPVKTSDLNPKGVLEGAVNGSVNSDSNNKLMQSNFSKFGNFPAIDFSIFNSREKLYFKGRNILVGTTLYTIIVVSKDVDPADYSKFLNSFKLRE
jgi:hypothetical protein